MDKVEESVQKVPVLVFFPPWMFKSINKISPNCFGDPILKSLPANLNIFFSKMELSFSNYLLNLLRYLVSTLIQFFSIEDKTLFNVKSI